MSKEFEEIVLEKLNALDERTQNIEKGLKSHQEEIDLIHDELKSHREEFNLMHDEIKSHQEEFDLIHNELKSHQEEFDLIHNELKSHREEFKLIHNTLNSTQESIKKLNNDFVVFDFEINKKIDTLFDAITVNNQVHDLFEKSIVSLNTKTFNQDVRISVLEDYNKNSKIFATS